MANTEAKQKTEKQIRKEYEDKMKGYEKEKDENRQEKINLKSRIKQLEEKNIEISKKIASVQPGQENRVGVGNLAQKLLLSGQPKKVIASIFEKVHGKGPAEAFLKRLNDSNYKPVIHPRVKEEMEAIDKEIKEAQEAQKNK